MERWVVLKEKNISGLLFPNCDVPFPKPRTSGRLPQGKAPGAAGRKALTMKEKMFSDLDPNFKSREIGETVLNFFDGFSAPFVLEGFPYRDDQGRRSRLPLSVAAQCEKEGVYPMSMQGAGEIIRFRTNSPKIGICAEFSEVFNGNNRGGSDGFDLYRGIGEESKFLGNRMIPVGADRIAALYTLHLPADSQLHDYALYFPYHCATSSIAIGILPGCTVEAPTPHRIAKPVVFYGSSITNCGSAGRPGLVYPSIIARRMDFPLINMGLSGSCRGELCIADTIAELDIAALVLEFDHNAPDPDFLAARHEPFFRRYRSRRPDTPVLMMSQCDFYPDGESPIRRRIIQKTWMNAVNAGDTHVEFLDGETLFAGPWREECTQDCCHPNDYGAVLMAERIADRLKRML